MKLTKKLETGILKAYNEYWGAYLKGDMRSMSYWMHDNIRMIGSGRGEVFENKKTTIKYYKSTADQVAGKADMRNRKISVLPVGDQVLVNEECDFFVLIGSIWTFYGEGRISTLFTKTNKGWKIIQEHGSMPDARTSRGEQVNTDKIKAENVRLKDAVKRRTIELEEKNHELEIETALEKVRAVAMGMNNPGDLLNVCKTLFKQFLSLGFNEMRNAMINIYNDADGSFINYDYSDILGKSTNQLTYTIHPLVEKEVKKVRKARDAFSETYFTGKDLTEWKKFRKRIGEKDDPRIAKSKGLYYYFYSTGIGSIGISTFGPISKEKKALLKRFRNVFNLSYQRYVDISKAEAQAREAEIELALERVRARTMAMQKSDELSETSFLLFQQLKKLGETAAQISIGIVKEEDGFVELSATVHGDPLLKTYHVPVEEPFMMKKAVKAWKEKKKTAVIEIKGKELKNYNKWRNSFLKKKIVFPEKKWLVHLAFFSKGMLSFSSEKELSKETFQLLERFSGVFDQTYTRFLDLQKAEAQAREAQIEAALERVRSSSLAMHKSEELRKIVKVVFEQLKKLNFAIDGGAFIGIPDITENTFNLWVGDEHAEYPSFFKLSYHDTAVVKDIWQVSKSSLDFLSKVYQKEEKNEWFRYAFEHTDFKTLPDKLKEWIIAQEYLTQTFTLAKHSGIGIHFHHQRTLTESEVDILKRFSKVFEQGYIRFLDLQKAEAQAREAQIEIGLERVRSRAMAMQSSEELNALIGTVFTELTRLDLALTRCIIWVFEFTTNAARWWMANSEEPSNPMSFFIKYHEHPAYLTFVKEWKNQNVRFIYDLKGKDKIAWDEILFNETELKNLPDVVKNGMRAPERVLLSASFNNFGGINVASLEPLSDEHFDILLRFAKVFDLTYTRFLDLQKAEAQAREAKIEAALEKVRSRTMAMQRSDELSETAAVLFQEFKKLGEEDLLQITIGIYNEAEGLIEFNVTSWAGGGEQINRPFILSIEEPTLLNPVFTAWKQQKKSIVVDLSGQQLEDWLKYRNANSGVTVRSTDTGGRRVVTVAFFSKGHISFSSSEPKSPETIQLLERFAGVFDLTYTRFLDLKNAEAQAKESQIQLALERVRARTMAMQHSDELKNAAALLFQQVKSLGVPAYSCGYNIWEEDDKVFTSWMSTQDGSDFNGVPNIPLTEDANFIRYVESKQKGEPFFVLELRGERMQEHYQYLKTIPAFREWFDYAVKMGFALPETQIHHLANFSQGNLLFITLEPCPEFHDVFKRFAAVFEQTYTRFLDLQKVEAQAREAQIEASLERVRSKTMAMHSSNDVGDTVATMFNEFVRLGIQTHRCGILIFSDEPAAEVWTAKSNPEGKANLIIGELDLTVHALLYGIHKAWKKKETFYTYIMEGDDLRNYYQSLNDLEYYPVKFDMNALPSKEFHSDFYFPEGCVFAFTAEPISDETSRVIKRFAAVFGQTYRRYLDLQKAEAQAREAQVEAALERVRSKTMAMHSSQDIAATVDILFQELTKLHVDTLRCGISIIHHTKEMEVWTANPDTDGKASLTIGKLPMSIYPSLEKLFEAWKNKESHFVYDLSGQDLVDYFTAINNAPDYPIRYDLSKLPPRQVINCFLFNEGALFAFTTKPLPPEAINIFKRFATLFGQTYRRYLDLQKAEALAREATIEAALEKVRGKAMAMYSSNDLAATASMVFTELRKLGINPIRCGVGLLNKESRKAQLYSATSSANEDGLSLVGWVQLEKHPVLEKIYDTWLQQKDYYPQLQGEQLRSYYKLLLAGLSVPAPDFSNEQKQFGHFIPFSIGCLYAWSDVPYNEEQIKILKRFASIIDLTFRRYLELQQSEANAKEAVKQAALDRIRADIASMRTLGDLNRIIPLIWNELTILGLPFIRCGVFIMDNEQQLIHTFLSTPEGKAIAAFHIPYETPGKIRLIPENWKKKTAYIDHWNDSDFVDFASTLVQQHVIESSEQYLASIPHGGFYLHFVPFLQGMLYVGNSTKLDGTEISLIESVADAFSTAYARYEDFNKLEAAKRQVDKTLVDLKQAQQQLVQSEKMASLGELTAGIAHEIQNPLNFVNNFSDVSSELLEEMKTELEKGNTEDAKAIADDVIQNLEKILVHGKRADGIVKSMLQHSRASSGKKEPTNINALADEYLRLAYHGLRAKDKLFNATMKTDYDETIGNINIVSQDIGRVILNLITNAFYVVTEKKKLNIDGYEPTVTVTTKKIDNIVEISVKDNGNGIPQKVLDKIFQPFFTTKPTGQGTGLGLSLSYDIVKAHGGEIKVETKEGEGSEFIISLPG